MSSHPAKTLLATYITVSGISACGSPVPFQELTDEQSERVSVLIQEMDQQQKFLHAFVDAADEHLIYSADGRPDKSQLHRDIDRVIDTVHRLQDEGRIHGISSKSSLGIYLPPIVGEAMGLNPEHLYELHSDVLLHEGGHAVGGLHGLDVILAKKYQIDFREIAHANKDFAEEMDRLGAVGYTAMREIARDVRSESTERYIRRAKNIKESNHAWRDRVAVAIQRDESSQKTLVMFGVSENMLFDTLETFVDFRESELVKCERENWEAREEHLRESRLW